jgi:GDP-4-dehydro-6-deoxy-D-mannose reductase
MTMAATDMRILVTGATGFVGGHLLEALLARGHCAVTALNRSGHWPADLAHLRDRVPLRACDLCDAAAVEAVLREVRPDSIFHLAGYAAPRKSEAEPEAAWDGNLTATWRLYDAVLRWSGRPRILFVSTGLVYGDAGGSAAPLTEDAPLRPATPYAVSKAAADRLSYHVHRTTGLAIVRARPFNHVGPRQSPDYAVASFARQLAAIARGGRPATLEVGNLDSRRDLTDVRDVVAAYLALMDRGRAGDVYNIASGTAWSMREVLDRLIAAAGVAVEIQARAELLRPMDPPTPSVDTRRLERDTGWRLRFSLDETLRDTLAYWMQQGWMQHGMEAVGAAGPLAPAGLPSYPRGGKVA